MGPRAGVRHGGKNVYSPSSTFFFPSDLTLLFGGEEIRGLDVADVAFLGGMGVEEKGVAVTLSVVVNVRRVLIFDLAAAWM
jgi:hypothetical protein